MNRFHPPCMKIRPYISADLEDIVAIFRSNIPKYFGPDEEPGLREFLRDFPDNYFVCELGGEVVGSGGIELNADGTVSLCWGMIRADHLGTGLGKQLTEFRIERSRKLHKNAPIVISTSQHTQGFYEKLGFHLTRHVPDGFGPGIDICEMQLD